MVFTCACACAYSLHESIQEQGCVCRELLYIYIVELYIALQ